MTTTAFACRRATPADADTIDFLARDLHALHHAAWPALFADAGPPGRDRAYWQAAVAGDGRAGFIAEQDGVAIGFVTVTTARESVSFKQPMRYASVNSVCVVDTARGAGVGRALMACAEAWAREQGAVDVRLAVADFNRRAMRLYEELGYVARSTVMGKPLAPLAGAPQPEQLQAQGADS